MFPEHFAVAESKKVLTTNTPHGGGMPNRDRSQLKELPMAKNWKILSNRIHGFELNYNAK